MNKHGEMSFNVLKVSIDTVNNTYQKKKKKKQTKEKLTKWWLYEEVSYFVC